MPSECLGFEVMYKSDVDTEIFEIRTLWSVCRLVLIGKNLDGDNIKKQFKQCLWQPLPLGWQCTTDENLGRKYYYNVETKKAQWTRPTETD